MTCGAGLALLGRGGREVTVSETCELDAHWGNVVLLLHMDGTNGSTSFSDSSSANHTVTAFGNAQVTTTDTLFTSTGAYLGDGTGDSLRVTNSTDFDFGTDDFTVEFWVRPRTFTSGPYAISRQDLGVHQGWYFYLGANGGNSGWGQRGPVNAANSLGQVTLDAWTHVAICRASGVVRVYYNGVAITFIASGLTTLPDTTNYTGVTTDLAIGNDFTGNSLDGRIEELRITKGVARYTGAFTSPTLPGCDGSGTTVVPPPTTVPPDVYTDAYWSSVLFLSAMDLTKVNDKTSVTYTLDSASVTATDPFNGAGALACVYPPSAPTSTPFEPPELAGVTLRGSSGGCVEFWLRPDAWEPWVSGAFRWANLAQQDSSTGDPLWALGIVDERQPDGSVAPCLQLFSHYLDGSTYLETWRRTQAALLLPFDGLWHHIALDFRYYSGFAQTLVLYLDGVELVALTAPSYTAGETIQFGGQTVFAPLEGVSPYTAPANITSSTFDGALDEIRVTASSRYAGSFIVPHYAFPRS